MDKNFFYSKILLFGEYGSSLPAIETSEPTEPETLDLIFPSFTSVLRNVYEIFI